MPNKQKTETDLIYRKASFPAQASGGSAPSTLNTEARSVQVCLSTETPVMEWDYEHGRVYTVLLASGAVLPDDKQSPLLDSHNRWSVRDQLGSLRDMQASGAELLATAFFSTTPEAEKAFTLVREGHLKDMSVGRIDLASTWVPEGTTEEVSGKTFTGPVKVVTRWLVKEGSFTPIGADKNAKTRAASDGKPREEQPMPGANTGRADQNSASLDNVQNSQTTSAQQTQPVQQNRAELQPVPPVAGASEEQIRSNVADILLIGRQHNVMDLAEAAIRSGQTVDGFRSQVLNHLASASAPSVMPRMDVGQDGADKFRAAAKDSVLMRAGVAVEKPAEGAADLRGFTLVEMARESLRSVGLSTAGDPYDMVGRAFTTSDFANVLTDVANASVIVGAQESNESFELWAGEVTANDFRDHVGVSLDSFSNLDEVPESGEYKYGKVSDSGVKYSVATFGKIFMISRQAIINDNLNVFTAIPREMGRAAMRTCGNIVYNLLTGNVKLSDGKELFHLDRKNLAKAGAKIAADSFADGVTAMGTQKGANGEALNITPSFLLCPVVKMGDAKTFLHSQVIGTQAQPNQINPWLNAAQPISDARLDFKDPKAWYLIGPKGWGINVAWLFGNKTPRVEQRQGWSRDGSEHKVSIDFGAYVQDPRALYKNPGA